MRENELQSPAVERNSAPRFPLWVVVFSAALAFALSWALHTLGSRPELFPPLLGGAESGPAKVLLLSALFTGAVALASALGSRLAGARGGLAAGLVLCFCWPAFLLVALSPSAAGLCLLLLVAALLFTGGSRSSSLAWLALLLAAAMLVVPALRDSVLGLWRIPEGLSWERLVLWRRHSALAPPVPVWGASVPVALGLASLVLLRGRREARPLLGMLLVALLLVLFGSRGWALALFALAVLSALAGVWIDGAWAAARSRNRRALSVLLISAVVLLGLAVAFSRPSESELEEAEYGLRLERARLLRDHYRYDEIRGDMEWMREHRPEDRRTRLAEAELLLARKQYHEAARAFTALRRDEPEWRESLMGAAWANFFNETYPTAIRYFQDILTEDPRNPRALVGLGSCEIYNSKNYVEAERLITEGLSIDERIPEGHHNMALLMIKNRSLYESEESLERLRHHAKRCMELDPTNQDMRRFARRSGWDDLVPGDPSYVPSPEAEGGSP